MRLLSNLTSGIEFVAFGDWGYSGSGLTQTADMIDSKFPYRNFTILLGDNFYLSGVESTNDQHFNLFTDVIAAKSGKGKRHYAILGNHDWIGNASAQIDYSNVNPDWYMPRNYYAEVIEEQNVIICFIFTDTSHMDVKQLSWIDEQLESKACANPKAWRIVSGHFPVYSAGIYGDALDIRDSLVPILHKHHVHLYLAGHEHIQSIFNDGQLIELISGCVGLPRSSVDWRKHDYFVWGKNGPDATGFMHFNVTENRMDVSFISSVTGKILAHYNVTNQGGYAFASYPDALSDVSSSESVCFSTALMFAILVLYAFA